MKYVITADGLRLAYDDQGQGTPVLCLPGLTRNMEDFEPVVRDFADSARIIRMDFRGRGASDYAEDFTTYSVLQEAQDVLALLDHLGLEKVAILGTSRGGLVAMMLAAMARDRLSGVFLNDVGPVVSTQGLSVIMSYIGKPPSFSSLAEAAAAMPAIYPDFHDVPASTWADMARRIYREEEGALKLRYDPKLRDAVAPAFEPDAEAPDLWPLFDAMAGLPLAVLRGISSNILSAETAAEMRQRRPDMRFVELAGRGHVPFLDEPDSRALISAWLEDIS